jgi:hypothetical protein
MLQSQTLFETSPSERLLLRAMAEPMVCKKKRLVAAYTIDVREIQDAIDAWLVESQSRDLEALLADLTKHVSFKTAPNASVMGKYSSLASRLIHVAPNTMLPSKKTELALKHLHAAEPIMMSRKLRLEEFLARARICIHRIYTYTYTYIYIYILTVCGIVCMRGRRYACARIPYTMAYVRVGDACVQIRAF